MKELQKTLIEKITELVGDLDTVDVELLDALDRTLGTVSSYLIATGEWKEN